MTRWRAATLIEVMVAGTILAIVLSTVAAAMSFGFSTSAQSRRAAAAERIAAGHLETLILQNRLGGVPARGVVVVNDEGQDDPFGKFTSSWSLEPNKPVPGASRIAVEVSWNDGFARTTRLVTYLARGAGGGGGGP